MCNCLVAKIKEFKNIARDGRARLTRFLLPSVGRDLNFAGTSFEIETMSTF